MTPASWHVVWKMFCGDTPTSLEVIVANTLNFKANFKFSILNFFGGPPSHFGCALSRFGQSLARINISGRSTPYGVKYSLPKVHFSGSKLTWNSKPLVDQSSPDLFHRTRNESLEITCLSDFRYLAPFQRYSRSKSEVVENCPKFCMFLAPHFFLGGGSAPSNFWTKFI